MNDHEASFVAWVAHQTARRPGRPCLFYRGLLEWRWRSWAQMAEHAQRIAEVLVAQPLGSRIELCPALTPDDFAVDWATQVLGLEIDLTTGLSRNPTVDVRSRPVRTPVAFDVTHATAGGAWTNGLDDRGSFFLSATAQVAVADLVACALPALPNEPIVMVAGDRADTTLRASIAWAAREGAVLVLEPDLEALAEAAAWVRPHVIVAPPRALPATRVAVRAQSKRWRRLVAVLPAMSSARDTVSPAERDAWQELGVTVAAPVAEEIVRSARRSAVESRA